MTTSQRRGWHRSRRIRSLVIGVATLAVAVPVTFHLGIGQAAVTPPPLTSPPYTNGTTYHLTDANSRPARQSSGKWSVIAVHPDAGGDWDLTVTRDDDSAGSDQYGDRTDFVVFDGSIAGAGRFATKVLPWNGAAGYDVAYNDQTTELPFSVHRFGDFVQVGGDQWPTDYPFYRDMDGQGTAGIRDVSLVAGQDYMIKSQRDVGTVFLMQGDGTPIQGRGEAVASMPAGKRCTWFRPRTSGTYGLVVTFDDGSSGYHDPQYVDIVKATPAQIRSDNLCDGARVDGR